MNQINGMSKNKREYFGLTDIEGRILELHSPDGVHECWLRAADTTEANVWFNALHSALASLTLKALRLASVLPDPPHLQHIGWLARRHCAQVRNPSVNYFITRNFIITFKLLKN
ncbi:Similar to stn-1: Syntrophin-1 (Caenorhabditis elegans) [Cotesia congregata]|uniref:Similar to stn-1: Syntrophin-1 (Caenorhabditis elegans) n=1 Tax=Cotesia congregata TaxID=51543 RepID=A0A8J2HK13_COTCN|nr:Similar to stn-1: Syntrophin-1 (Caenorhabditis elegans) [Cotesia congregata]